MGDAKVVVLQTSRLVPYFAAQTHLAELAFMRALADAGLPFTAATDPSEIFERSVVWYLPVDFSRGIMRPRLWDYSRQAKQFAEGLERQDNRPFCSSKETAYWENKALMHRSFEKHGLSAPRTMLIAQEDLETLRIPFEPALVKEEHSAGSAGIHYFAAADEAIAFARGYRFRPTERLLAQELVRGATRDLRLTMVGKEVIDSASYWRIKPPVTGGAFITTATENGSTVEHQDIPRTAIGAALTAMSELDLRTAAFDFMWEDDDVETAPLMLELSPYYQPNPPKPMAYANWSYGEYKKHLSHGKDAHLVRQYDCFREVARSALSQDLV